LRSAALVELILMKRIGRGQQRHNLVVVRKAMICACAFSIASAVARPASVEVDQPARHLDVVVERIDVLVEDL
jgi:hypothetical protein